MSTPYDPTHTPPADNHHAPGQPAPAPAQQPWSGSPHGQQQWAPPPQQWQPSGQQLAPYGTGPSPRVEARNPILYALASFLIAGLGTGLGGRVGRAIMIFCTVVFTGLVSLIPFIGWLMFPFFMGAWVFSIFDGYQTAKKWNARHGIIS